MDNAGIGRNQDLDLLSKQLHTSIRRETIFIGASEVSTVKCAFHSSNLSMFKIGQWI
jgi:hypothetical protein